MWTITNYGNTLQNRIEKPRHACPNSRISDVNLTVGIWESQHRRQSETMREELNQPGVTTRTWNEQKSE